MKKKKFNHKADDFCDATGIEIDDLRGTGIEIMKSVFGTEVPKKSMVAEQVYKIVDGKDYVLLASLFVDLLRSVAEAAPLATLSALSKHASPGESDDDSGSDGEDKDIGSLLERLGARRVSKEELMTLLSGRATAAKEERAEKLSDVRKPKDEEPEGGSSDHHPKFDIE